MKLKEALELNQPEVISLVGAGGKTTLMFSLAQELASEGEFIVTTTTTKILVSEPLLHNSPCLIVEKKEEKPAELVWQNLERYKHVTLVSEKLPAQGKLQGICPELVDELAKSGRISYVIVEADGAAHRSLKAPNPTEPVIPRSTTLVIPVVGIDAFGCRLDEEKVFRPHLVSQLVGLSLGGIITADVITTLVTHPEGLAKGSPAKARIIPFLNKMDLDLALSRGRSVAIKILEKRHPQIGRVILGQARAAEPVVEVISMSNLTGRGCYG
jgi:molybdenum cofactor cytidylyltransferase